MCLLAPAVTWTLYEISRHPEIQEQLREEIYTARKAMKARGDTEFNMTDLDSMRLLLAVIKVCYTLVSLSSRPPIHQSKETLRFHPIAYNLIREIDRDDILPLSKPITTASGREVTEIPVSKGQRFIISVCGYQRCVVLIARLLSMALTTRRQGCPKYGAKTPTLGIRCVSWTSTRGTWTHRRLSAFSLT